MTTFNVKIVVLNRGRMVDEKPKTVKGDQKKRIETKVLYLVEKCIIG